MLRKLHHIPLSQLAVSKLNVRRHGAKEIDSLAASIAALGIIQPLLVRRDGSAYEIVAGRRRYLAAKALDARGVNDVDKLPCVLLEGNDDATAIEASLAENVERLPMDDLEQYEAFAALRRKGVAEADIAAHFGISEQIVKRRLAIARLRCSFLPGRTCARIMCSREVCAAASPSNIPALPRQSGQLRREALWNYAPTVAD